MKQNIPLDDFLKKLAKFVDQHNVVSYHGKIEMHFVDGVCKDFKQLQSHRVQNLKEQDYG